MGKVANWNRVRRLAKQDFDNLGIRFCELCASTFALGFAHRLRRRFITDDQELRTGLALLCQPCHQRTDAKPHDETYRIITELIENRTAIYDTV